MQRRKENREKEATTSDLGTERERERERCAVRDVQRGGDHTYKQAKVFSFYYLFFLLASFWLEVGCYG